MTILIVLASESSAIDIVIGYDAPFDGVFLRDQCFGRYFGDFDDPYLLTDEFAIVLSVPELYYLVFVSRFEIETYSL